MLRRTAFILGSAALAATLASCGPGEPAATTLPEDVDAVLTAASEAMGTIDTVRFRIERSGAAVFIDNEGILAFESAEGRFAAPSSADALVTVKALGLTTQVGAIAIDGDIYLTNPVTGRWEPAPDDFTFDPATLFDPDTGWRPLLRDDLTGATLVERIESDEGVRYRIEGRGAAERVSVITGGLVDQDADLDLLIDATTGHVVSVAFDTTTTEGRSSWVLELTDYGADVTIEPPDLDGNG